MRKVAIDSRLPLFSQTLLMSILLAVESEGGLELSCGSSKLPFSRKVCLSKTQGVVEQLHMKLE